MYSTVGFASTGQVFAALCSPSCPKFPLKQNRLSSTFKGAFTYGAPFMRNSRLSGSRLSKMDCLILHTYQLFSLERRGLDGHEDLPGAALAVLLRSPHQPPAGPHIRRTVEPGGVVGSLLGYREDIFSFFLFFFLFLLCHFTVYPQFDV